MTCNGTDTALMPVTVTKLSTGRYALSGTIPTTWSRRDVIQVSVSCTVNGKTFAAILLDLTLPGMDGYECTKRIRELERGGKRRIPIIALTGRATASDRNACLAAGMNDYISKPFNHEELRRILLRWVYEPNRPNLKVLAPYDEKKRQD